MSDKHFSAYGQYADQLHSCAAHGDVSGILAALKVLSDVDAANERGWTALMFAARNGQLEAVRTLLENGCDASSVNNSGQTAKDIAEFWLHDEIVAMLSVKSSDSDQSLVSQKSVTRQHSNYFCNNPLDRMSEYRSDADWIAEMAAADDTTYILFVRLDLAVQTSSGNADGRKPYYRPVRLLYKQLKATLESQQPTVVFLGVERSSKTDMPSSTNKPEQHAWFAVNVDVTEDELKNLCPGAELVFVHPRMLQLPRTEAAIIAQARSMLAWHDRYQFCPTCGATTTVKDGGYKRVCTCKDCRSNSGVHNTCYPRTDPTVIAAIVSPDRRQLLLGRGKRFPGLMFSCLAGFIEPGESIEEACRREVREESGIHVDRVDYHSSQPWPMPSSLMIGCIGHAKTLEITVNKDELEDARWFTVHDVRLMLNHQHPQGFFCPPAQAIAHQLIKHSLNNIMPKL